VNIEVIPLKNLKEQCFLVSFKEGSKSDPDRAPISDQTKDARSTSSIVRKESRRIIELELELAEAREYAQSLQERHEVANEELQASSEEVQSANEELQSSNEELETSKEELESTNEELTTVNEEMAHRNLELDRVNNDLINLQISTNLPIVLLGSDLTIRRFSPQAEKQFNLVTADVGRPFGNIRHNLELPDLEKLIADVISTKRECEREVRDKEGRWYSIHILPYLTSENKTDGAALVLVDISAIKKGEQAVVAGRDFAEAIIRTARDPFLILDAQLRIERANEAFFSTFKVTRAESVGQSVFELDHGHWDIPRLRELLQDILPRRSFFNNFEVTHNFERIGHRTMLLNARALSETAGQPARILLGIQDISELLHFQAQMRHSELRYRRLFEAGKDGILIIDPSTRKIVDANPYITDLLEYPHGALLGKELFEIGLLKDEAASQAAFAELKKKGFIRYENLPLKTKSGQRRDVEFVSNLYQEGETKVIQCNIRDVTQRRQAEEALRASEERFRHLVEGVKDYALFTMDLAGRVTTWNYGGERMHCFTAEEILGKYFSILFDPRDIELGIPQRALEAAAATGRYENEGWRVRKDGSRFWADVIITAVKDKSGAIQSYSKMTRDVTERRKTEQQLLEKARLLDLSNDAIIVRDLNNKIRLWNKGAERLYGWTAEEVTGRDLDLLEAEFSKPMEEIVEQLHNEGHFSGEVVQTARDGRHVPSLCRWVLDRDTESILTSYTDISERKQMEDDLRAAHLKLTNRADELEEAVLERTGELTATNKQLEAFVYSIAHDLRAPLRSMQGFSAMLLDEEGGKMSETGRDFAQRISKSAQFMDALLMDLLTFSAVAQQRIELGLVNLETMVRLTLVRFEKEIQEKRARVEISGTWPAVLGHEPTLGQVLVNLVNNAIKFVGPNIQPIVRLRSEERGEFIRVWVEDNGIGISRDHQSQIFRLFIRLQGEKFPGTGIGLAIVEKGVERMGGRVGVESTLGQGSAFWFELKKA
jgi:PAS domain S-box-containing protein